MWVGKATEDDMIYDILEIKARDMIFDKICLQKSSTNKCHSILKQTVSYYNISNKLTDFSSGRDDARCGYRFLKFLGALCDSCCCPCCATQMS